MTKPSNRVVMAISMLLVTVLNGCMTVGPAYQAPSALSDSQWNAGTGKLVTTNNADALLTEWWSVLDDPMLTGLIRQAKDGNLDLRQAEARLREARAQRGLAKADLAPTVSANGSARRSTSSREMSNGDTSDSYAMSLDASWELDFFGKKRRSLESSEAAYQASQEEVRDVQVSLLAEVALNYVEVRSYQARLSITETNLAAQVETYDLTRWRWEAGLTTQLDVEQARSSMEQTRAELPSLRTSLEQAQNQLAVLLGQRPGGLRELLAQAAPVPVTPLETAIGVPADLLRRRPDVRRRERELAAQTAKIGVAAAARYPSFTLTGSIGLEALQYANLYTAGARVAQGVLSGAWTLFDGGRIRQNIAIETARQEQALALYEATVLTAQQDVENALIAYAQQQTRRQSLTEAERAAKTAFDLAREQYSSGLVDFQTVLDSQRALLSLQSQLAISTAEVTTNLIRLYKALGGGWNNITAGQQGELKKS